MITSMILMKNKQHEKIPQKKTIDFHEIPLIKRQLMIGL